MRNFAIPVIVTAIVVGAASGAAVSLLTAPEDRPLPAPAPGDSGLTAEVLEEVRALRKENRGLLDRVSALEGRPAAIETASFDDKILREELATLAERVQELSARPAGGADPSSADGGVVVPDDGTAFTAAVEKTLNSIRRREKADGWRAGTRNAQANLDKRLDELQKKLNLTNSQVDQLRTATMAQAERNLQLIQAWEQRSTPREQLGETKRENHEQHQQALRSILTPTQLEQYHADQRRRAGK